MLSCAVARAASSKAPLALTVPLRTASFIPYSTSTGSPVSADSSNTALPAVTRPSTGTTSPEPTMSTSPATTDSNGTCSTSSPTRRRAVRGARSSSVRRSREARRSAAASSVRPVASIKAISDPARYSPTTSVPTRASVAITSTPARPRRNAAMTHPTDGGIAATVPAAQNASARSRAPKPHATPPASRPMALNASNPGSSHLAARAESLPRRPLDATADHLDPALGHLPPFERGHPQSARGFRP